MRILHSASGAVLVFDLLGEGWQGLTPPLDEGDLSSGGQILWSGGLLSRLCVTLTENVGQKMLHFTARCYAVARGYAMASCPSVRPSVTLRYRGHIGWNSWEIISRLISLNFSLSADPNITDLLQRENPPNFSPNRSGVWKNWL